MAGCITVLRASSPFVQMLSACRVTSGMKHVNLKLMRQTHFATGISRPSSGIRHLKPQSFTKTASPSPVHCSPGMQSRFRVPGEPVYPVLTEAPG
jgi:hypothetical protein